MTRTRQTALAFAAGRGAFGAGLVAALAGVSALAGAALIAAVDR